MHADELQRIASEAELLESQKHFRAARERWLSALSLLPANAQQANWIKHHVIDLLAQAVETEQQQKGTKKSGLLALLFAAWKKAKSLFARFMASFR